MKSLKERRADPEGTSRSLHPSKGKRKASSEGGERRKKRRPEEETQEPARATISKGPTSESRSTAGKAPEQESTEAPYVLLDTSALSFMAKPSGLVSLDFIRRLVHDQDFDLVRSVPDLAALEAANLHFMQALVWSGEVSNRLAQARDEVVTTKRSLDGVLGRHNDLMQQLEEITSKKDKEKESVLLELEATRAEAQSSKAQFLHSEENKALRAEVEKLKGRRKTLGSSGRRNSCDPKSSISCARGGPPFSLNRASTDAWPSSMAILKKNTRPLPRR
ncbi:pleiotropic drug resistance protein 1-like [Dorcoceras hygrometricum]|uniref:Pleiotropic drug resistance protein 1-like n=1 Tax=Dorcoceras hygrometricum TaxID=472368 RepID=A0A2Z7BIY1_9LAMI|nr:pleiotropic drug resistance protein 1-like [Dorcoceras hygrometricum]